MKNSSKTPNAVINCLHKAGCFILIGVGLSVLFWFIESWIHTLRVGHGDLLQEILRPEPHEIWMRSLVCFIVVSFSVYAQIIIKRLRRAKASLQKLSDELELRVRERTAELDEVNNKLKGAVEEYKQAEETLRLERNKLHALIDRINRAGIGFSIIGIDHKIQLQNEVMEQRFGKINGELCYKHYVMQEEPCELCPVTEAIQQNSPAEIEQRGLDGRDYQIFSAPLPDADGSVSKAIEIYLDITERKRTKKALAENERRFRATFEQAAVGIAHVAPNGSFIRINQKFCDIVGYTRTEMLDRTFQEITHPDDLDADLDYIRQVLAGEISTYSMEKRYFRKDGSIIWVNLTVSLLRKDSGEPNFFISVAEDITERKHLEEQTIQHQAERAHVSRLSTLGEMASGLAHELNQPLCAIQSRADLCLRALEDHRNNNNKVKENLQTIEGQAERAGNIIRRIKAFVRKRELNRNAISISSLVRETLAFVDSEIRHNNIKVSLELAEQIPMVLADKIQIEQVLLNLIRNAVEAMAETEQEKRKLIIQTKLDSDDMVEVTVRDNGEGLKPKAQEHLFDAFFTTKSNGLGIGLSISHSIIGAHHGQLRGEPNSDGGSTFTFTLPLSKSKVLL